MPLRAVSPVTTAATLVGTTTNDNAAAGIVGEYISNSATAVSASNNVAISVTSISLTAGDWDVTGLVQTNPAGTTTQSGLGVGISTTNNAFSTIVAGFTNFQELPIQIAAGAGFINASAPVTRISLASTTTVYIVAQVGFGVSTMTLSGFIRARRVR